MRSVQAKHESARWAFEYREKVIVGRSNYRVLPLAAILGLILLAACSPPTARPNIVVLFVDDLGWLDIGYRSLDIDTPNIDRFAREGVSFERAYADAPVCSPSRVGLITGQHPARHEFFRHVGAGGKDQFDAFGRTDDPYSNWPDDPAHMPSRNWLPLDATTVAERLKVVGYHTAFVGKWHIGHEPVHPIEQGFDEQHGVTNFGHPKSYYPPYFNKSPVYADASPDTYLTDRVTADAVGVIERSAENDKPLFLSLWWYNVHRPPVGRRDLVEKYSELGLEGDELQYAAQVEALDQAFATVIDALNRTKMRDNTIVVLASDQGGYYPREPLKGKKSGGLALYEGGARVPLYVRGIAGFEANTAITVPVSLLDVAPTILGAAGADLEDLDGRDLASVVKGDDTDNRPIIMYRHYEDLYAGVIVGNWKLLASVSGAHELYNLSDDPSERTDLAVNLPEKVAELLAVLENWKVEKGIKRFDNEKDGRDSA